MPASAGGGNPHSFRRHCIFSAFLSWLCQAVVLPAQPQESKEGNVRPRLVIGFTAAMMSEMNRNDAGAAVKVLADTLVRKRMIAAVPYTEIYDDLSLLRRALKTGDADIVSLRIDEYFALEAEGTLDPAFVGLRNRNWAEEYVLLVNRESGFQEAAELRSKRLITLSGRRTGLARTWLDTVLLGSNLPDSSQFFAEIKESNKVSRTVLPIYFRQGDACLVTSSGFATMVDLNPQVGKQLNVLCMSPPLLPSLICLRRDLDSSMKALVIDGLSSLHQDAAGQQALMLFTIDRLAPCTRQHIESATSIVAGSQQARQRRSRTATAGGEVGQGNQVAIGLVGTTRPP